MEVFLATPRGFCAGVVRAIDVVDLALEKYGPPVYVKHEIVHNPYVVETLEAKGSITVQDVDEIPPNSVVVFSAHGSPPEDFKKAKERGLKVIDATCPLVTKVHNEARKYAKEGQKILLVGHPGHQEVMGTMGQASMELVDEREEINLPDWDPSTPVAVLTQTTLSVMDTARAVEEIRERFPNARIKNDICYATTNRQVAVKQLAAKSDLVLVIGAQQSSNCSRLRDVAEANGVPAFLINGANDLDGLPLDGVQRIGIISGASTPELLVEQVVKALKPEKVTTISSAAEDITFVLPREFRNTSSDRVRDQTMI
ncbi:MAG: 4-hydroxy-3-methylbut-2-enyl diphosphate reductase [Chloroflexi bacterium]|nr:4-hydroxy-3-methylbut-2-enyl diphosphate reductase [Chloroflexota bacterium]